MSTRAIYSFFGDDDAPRHVYKHSDGYPTGAAEAIENALEFAWPLPRYENDEFAAAFVAANKSYLHKRLLELYRKKRRTPKDNKMIAYHESALAKAGSGGQIRLIAPSGSMIPAREAAAAFAVDAEYRYEVRCLDGELHVKVFATNYWDGPEEEEIFSGPFKAMKTWAEEREAAEQAA